MHSSLVFNTKKMPIPRNHAQQPIRIPFDKKTNKIFLRFVFGVNPFMKLIKNK